MSAFSRFAPTPNAWYWSYGELFQVLALDEDEDSVEIRYEDGSVAEIAGDEWSLRAQAGALHVVDSPDGELEPDDSVDARRPATDRFAWQSHSH